MTDPADAADQTTARSRSRPRGSEGERVILFVCTGNTCRSPMAAAIAEDVLAGAAASGGVGPFRVLSAGLAAADGMPMTREAQQALRTLGVPVGIPGADHASRRLTRELLDQADEVYAMTRAHLEGVRRLDPALGRKVSLLDPDGQDVADPIGYGMDTYLDTARRLRGMIIARLRPPAQPHAGPGGPQGINP